MKADRDARELSARSTRYMVVASLLGMAVAIYFAMRLQKSNPPADSGTSAVSKELGEGEARSSCTRWNPRMSSRRTGRCL